MAATPEQLKALAAPFAHADLEWRVGRSGIKNGRPWASILAYVTNRAIQQRLDDTVGPACWRNEYREGVLGGILCGLSVYCADGEQPAQWIAKWDGADKSDIEPVKGGLSNAMKRAAVQWGIGRDLYEMGEAWAEFGAHGEHSAKIDGQWFKWSPPAPAGSAPRANAPTVAPLAVVRDDDYAGGPNDIDTVARELGGVVRAAMATTATPATTTTSDAAVSCPKCQGPTWDNRLTKRSPNAPDYKCRDRACDGCVWPPREAKAGSAASKAAGSRKQAVTIGGDDLPF